jgi:hypothetical protein
MEAAIFVKRFLSPTIGDDSHTAHIIHQSTLNPGCLRHQAILYVVTTRKGMRYTKLAIPT